jgi:hypothetical protein
MKEQLTAIGSIGILIAISISGCLENNKEVNGINLGVTMDFHHSECGVFAFNKSEIGINETLWLNNNSLCVKAYILINCGEIIENGGFQIVNNTISLYYISPECVEECMDCMCGVVLFYNFSNLEKKDYNFELIRLYQSQNNEMMDYFTSQKNDSLMNDSCIKIEQNVASYGDVIEGNYTELSLALVLDCDYEINESLKAVYIYTRSDGGVVHGYLEKHYGVYNIPYNKYGFEIIDIYKNGAIRIHFKNMEIVLSSGEEWKISTSKIDTQSYDFGEIGEITGKALFTTTYSIVNHGFVEKSSLSNSTFNVVEV